MPYPTPLAYKSNWESNMTTWGDYHKNDVFNGSFDEKLLSTYYDGGFVYFRLKDYTGTSSWGTVATDFIDFFRDQYVVPNNGAIPGYWNFTHGLTEDYLRNADTASRDAVRDDLAVNAAFANDATPLSSTVDYLLSREVAYTVMCYLNAERCGASRRVPRLSQLFEQMLGHMDQWFVSQTAGYVRPFMVALTARALIMYHETIGDSRIVPMLETAYEWLWQNTWLPGDLTFKYTDRVAYDNSGGEEPSPDLNLLILPVFGYLYYQTGDTTWITRGDQVFQGGVVGAGSSGNPSGAYLAGSGKQFNQNYFWSFDYLTWREATPLQEPPGDGDPPPAPSTSDATFSILIPINRETYSDHFANRGWTTLQAKIDAGYHYWLHPTPLSGQFLETLDIGVLITEATNVVLQYSIENIVPTVTAVPTISVSADNATFTDYANQTSVLASNFRYVKIKLDFTASSDKAFARIREMRLMLFLKKKRDGGGGVASASDTNGTQVNFNKSFLDIDSITVTAEHNASYRVHASYVFADAPNPTGFQVMLHRLDTGARVSGNFSWAAEGK